MNYEESNESLINILNYRIPRVSENVRFWMIRTKKGFFYNEYINNGYVALGWNTIDKKTDLKSEILPDILRRDHGVNQTTKVINKCNDFVNSIKPNDIIIIPNRGLEEITIVLAGEYYEDDSKTIEEENEISLKIDNNEATLAGVICPYKKRRRITPIRTVKTEKINYHLYSTLRNYNGIDDIDEHAILILGLIYDAFIYGNDLHITLNVNQENDIGLPELSGMLYGSTQYFGHFIDRKQLVAKINLSSEGQILIAVKDAIKLIADYGPGFVTAFLAMAGSIKIIKAKDVPKFFKDLFTIKEYCIQEKIKTQQEQIKTDIMNEELREKRLSNDKKEDEYRRTLNAAQEYITRQSNNGLPSEFEQSLILQASSPLKIQSVELPEDIKSILKNALEEDE